MTSKVAVLLGAGASADAGIPTSFQMTDAVIDRIGDGDVVRLLRFIRKRLTAHGHRWLGVGRSFDQPVDVERLFTAVELLAERDHEPWTPFVASCDPELEALLPRRLVEDWEILEPFAKDVAALARRTLGSPSSHVDVGRVRGALAPLKIRGIESVRHEEIQRLLGRVRDLMLESLYDLLAIHDPKRVEYLKPLIDLVQEQGSLTVATLNYDRSMELLAERYGEPCDTGIKTWLAEQPLQWQAERLVLLKLHGSIDWVVHRPRWKRIFHPDEVGLHLDRFRVVDSPAHRTVDDDPGIVFGEAGKLESHGPYLELLLAWAARLQKATDLVVVGYSFRDAHVNQFIARWFNKDDSRRLVIVDPSESVDGLFGFQMKAYCDPRLNPPRVLYLKGTAAAVLPEAIRVASRPARAFQASGN
jgi:hypothetical protein